MDYKIGHVIIIKNKLFYSNLCFNSFSLQFCSIVFVWFLCHCHSILLHFIRFYGSFLHSIKKGEAKNNLQTMGYASIQARRSPPSISFFSCP